MKKLLIFFLLFPAKILGDYIIHEKIYEAPPQMPCQVEVFLNVNNEEIHRFSLLYRSAGNIEYIETPMVLIHNSMYIAEIPTEFMRREKIEYYLLLEMPNHKEVTLPPIDAVNNPVTINIVGSEKDSSSDESNDLILWDYRQKLLLLVLNLVKE